MAWSGSFCSLRRSQPPPLCSPPFPSLSPPLPCPSMLDFWPPDCERSISAASRSPGPWHFVAVSTGNNYGAPRGFLLQPPLLSAPFVADCLPLCLTAPTPSLVLLGLNPQIRLLHWSPVSGSAFGEAQTKAGGFRRDLGKRTHRPGTYPRIAPQPDGPAAGRCNSQGSPEKHNQ